MAMNEPYKSLIQALIKVTDASEAENEGVAYLSHATSDVAVTFEKESKKFVGLSFTILGLEFAYTNNELVTITSDDVRAISDEGLIKKVKEFLSWRAEVLSQYEL